MAREERNIKQNESKNDSLVQRPVDCFAVDAGL